MLSAETVARDFNKWISRQHALGTGFELNFAKLKATINTFIIAQYPNLKAEDLPEVHEIEQQIRSKWAMKSVKTRARRAHLKKRKEYQEQQRAAQGSFSF